MQLAGFLTEKVGSFIATAKNGEISEENFRERSGTGVYNAQKEQIKLWTDKYLHKHFEKVIYWKVRNERTFETEVFHLYVYFQDGHKEEIWANKADVYAMKTADTNNTQRQSAEKSVPEENENSPVQRDSYYI